MRKYLQYILAICLLFCACDDREIVESGAADDNAVTMSFYAGIESYPDSLQTRTVLGGIVSDNTRKVLWLPDDDIYVTNGTTGAKFTNIKTETASIAEFEGSISPGDNYFAVFPYSMVTGYSSSQFQINLPSVQQYVKDGIAAESFPMVAQCADNQFNFKNVCGILVLNLTGEDVIDSIRFSGIDAGDKAMKVAGVGTIQANYGVYPVMNMLSAAKDYVTLSCTDYSGKGVTLNKTTPTAFHIVLPVATYSSFELQLFSSGKQIKPIKSDKTLTIRRSERTTTSSLEYVAFEPEAVDLGLSVKWATCNVGAFVPEGYGKYYAWGETNSKDVYDWSTYKYCNGTYNSLTKYCYVSSFGEYGANGFIDDKITLDLEDDVANVEWGDEWHIPSRSEFNELFSNCSWTKTSRNGISGYLVTSNISGFTNQSIFLPAAGYKYSSSLVQAGNTLLYSINGLDTALPPNGCGCFHQYVESNYSCDGGRQIGLSVRPVRPSNNWANYITITLETESVELMLGHTLQLIPTVKHNNDVVVYEAVEFISDNPSVVTVSKTGLVKGINTGTAIITASISGKSATCTVTVKPEGHEYVDLGLSVKWATCNVGATAPEEYGEYFAWGETSQKSEYTWTNLKYCQGSSFYKYNQTERGTKDNRTVLDLSDDAARANWGGSWRMPTEAEFQELIDKCTWVWTKMNGKNGYKVVSKSNWNAIFLPAAGYCLDEWRAMNKATIGYYWSSSLGGKSSGARYLHIGSSSHYTSDYERYCGLSVRPVYPVSVTGISLDKQSVEIMEGCTETLTATVSYENGATGNTATWTSSNTGVASVDDTGKITAVLAGTCTITATVNGVSATCTVTVKPCESGYEYVDLGLSVKWATFNVGAEKPEDYGDYFAWGETSPKANYSWSTYKYCNGSNSTMTKYCTSSSYGTVDNKTVLDLSDDAAHVNWGGSWRMPTKAEQDELRNNCTWTWTTLNDVKGYKVVGKNGNSIFLPAAGYRDESWLFIVGSHGYYWSSSRYEGYSYLAYYLDFDSSYVDWGDFYRYHGRSVRAVCP